ncbi:MAG: DUF4105 domain-containing protein [Tepidisphaeraceae bacterium]
MSRLSRTLLCLLLILLASRRASAEPVATLVTVGPGDAVWEKFGHNMIRIQDDERGLDICFNWGLFNFDQPNFIGNFVQGRMLYTMAPLDSLPLLDDYKQQDRRVTFQRLRLSPEQVRARCSIAVSRITARTPSTATTISRTTAAPASETCLTA